MTFSILAQLTEHKAKKAELDMLDKELKAMKAELIEYVMSKTETDETGKNVYHCGQYIVTVSQRTRETIDKNGLEAAYPEIAAEYTKITEFPELRVK